MADERGTHTQATGMMAIEVITYGERIEVGPCFRIVRFKWSHHCLVDGTTQWKSLFDGSGVEAVTRGIPVDEEG